MYNQLGELAVPLGFGTYMEPRSTQITLPLSFQRLVLTPSPIKFNFSTWRVNSHSRKRSNDV